MVWFHGGAFAFGSSNQIRLRGSRLCRRDVVVVTVNQRLNIFGHLDLSEIGGPDFARSGNAGTLDMLAALEWVRDNVAAFGGDPRNVTIFGESGGGGKVSTLLAMPRARGLFHKAIIQSGAAVRLRERDRATRLAEAVLATLRIERTELHRLRELPMRQLLAAIEPAQRAVGASPWPLFDRYPFGPTMDGPGEGSLVPRHPFHPRAPALSADIPLVIGDTADEATSFLAHDDAVWRRTLTEAEMVGRIRPLAGPHTERVAGTYRRLLPGASPAERLTATLTDANFRLRSLLAAERKAQGDAPVWMYSFAWRTPVLDGRLGAPHALDVPFTFDTIDLTNATDRSPQAHRLAEIMSDAWARFAHTGRMAHEGMPEWPAYTPEIRATMVLDAPCRLETDPRAETRRLWEEIAAPG
jgi:para-nitrobenzyl esterase